MVEASLRVSIVGRGGLLGKTREMAIINKPVQIKRWQLIGARLMRLTEVVHCWLQDRADQAQK